MHISSLVIQAGFIFKELIILLYLRCGNAVLDVVWKNKQKPSEIFLFQLHFLLQAYCRFKIESFPLLLDSQGQTPPVILPRRIVFLYVRRETSEDVTFMPGLCIL